MSDEPTINELLECAVEMQRELDLPIPLTLEGLREAWDFRQTLRTKTTRDLFAAQADALDKLYGIE